jgi:hypothetical protein
MASAIAHVPNLPKTDFLAMMISLLLRYLTVAPLAGRQLSR